MRIVMFLRCLFSITIAAAGADLRLGIIGTDTSHAPEFAKLLNGGTVPGARVVAAYKGGSPDFEQSRARIERFSAELKDKWNVEFVPDIATLCARVDGVLLLSVDGRTH